MDKRLIPILMVCAVLSSVLVIGSSSVAQPAKDTSRYIVKFEKPISEHDEAFLESKGCMAIRKLGIINSFAIEATDGQIKAIKKNPNIVDIHEDHVVRALEVLPWGVDRIDAELVWNGTDGGHDVTSENAAGSGINVSILDTGVDYNHPDLAENVKDGYAVVNSTAPEGGYMDDNGHGTHCAGIVAAVDNKIGVIGTSPKADLYGVKVLDSEGSGYESDVVAGVEWSINHSMNVISMSLGSDSDLPSLHAALDEAYDAGLLSVAAAGNDGFKRAGFDTVDYPARYESVIAVGATDKNDERAIWGTWTASSTGPDLELAAPGDEINSTYWNNTYETLSGTSMACPHVTGTAALVWKAYPDYNNTQVRQRMQETAEDLGPEGKDNEFGYGLVDAEKAAYVPTPDTTPPVISNVTATDITSSSAKITWDTDEPADSLVKYGTESWNYTYNVSDSTYVTSHAIDLTGLSANTTYYYVANSTDEAGNSNESSEHSFTTEKAPAKPEMHIGDIIMSSDSIGRGPWTWYKAIATVPILDSSDNPVDGATVEGHWSGAYSDDVSGVTGSDGKVTFETKWVKDGGTFNFTVDNVTKEGWIYNEAANVETSDSITV